jgi:hypothetical protein
MEHNLPLSVFLSPLSERNTKDDIQQNESCYRALAHTRCRKRPITSCCTERDRSKKGGRGEEGRKGEEEIGTRRMNGWERSGETLNPIR